jgi:hypothetical protein
MEGKIKWKLSEVDTRVKSRGQKKLIGKFKMAKGDQPFVSFTNSWMPSLTMSGDNMKQHINSF